MRKRRGSKQHREALERIRALELELGLDDGVADLSEDAEREQALAEMRAKQTAKRDDTPLVGLARKWERDSSGGLVVGEPMLPQVWATAYSPMSSSSVPMNYTQVVRSAYEHKREIEKRIILP